MKEFLEFVAGVMEVDSSELSEDTAYGEYEKWDSLMHIRLIMETEEKYDTEIPIDEVPRIKNLKDLYRYTHK